jgi:hypothetical protein
MTTTTRRLDAIEIAALARDASASYNEEYRDALRHADPFTPCYRHHHVRQPDGSGVCRCGDTVSAGEL